MNKRPFILITNDDGISASGIRYLVQAIQSFADCAIVAPLTEKSGSGLSITSIKPLRVATVNWDPTTPAWSVSGTPADCVKMACTVLLKKRPDMIVSGINHGSNAGRTVLYSGTVGGVIEGIFKNIPGIAFSSCELKIPENTQQFIVPLVQYFLKNPLPKGTFFNVNIPAECKGFKLAKQGQGYWVEDPDKRIHPEGLPYYWLGGKWGSLEEDPESDVALLQQGYATGVPIHVNQLTDLGVFPHHKKAIEGLFAAQTTASSSKR